ncbi:MAG: flagellar protein FliT [Candidatus Dactylopiibacterium sp.]|nr:flagellar protein FliT [Candidatus Dactylopiibacterium sp.]
MASTITFYESMSELSGKMAAAARANDWPELERLEHELSALRDRLRIIDPPSYQAALPEAERQRKVVLIRQILAEDREIRAHVQPWMESVRGMLSSGTRQRALNSAYGLHSN